MDLAYKPGDIIIDNCDAFVKILSIEFKNSRCHNCFAEKGNLKSCSSCKILMYCDKKCQLQDWKIAHKLECKSKCFREYCQIGMNADVKAVLFRMYALLKLHPDLATKPYTLHDGTTKCFNDLMSHQENLARDVAIKTEGENMAKRINSENPEVVVTVDYFFRLFGIHKTNCFGILNESESCQIGVGIFVQPSTFNHSCKPTAFYQNKGIQLQIRAIGPIPKGEEPHISYLSSHLDKAERQKLLQERYNFECHCEKCDSNSDSDVNYVKLNSMVARMKLMEAQPYFGGDWRTIYAHHEEIIKMFRKMYHEYDERITNQFNRAFTIAINLRVDRRELKELYEVTRQHLMITNGKNHSCYKSFLESYADFFK